MVELPPRFAKIKKINKSITNNMSYVDFCARLPVHSQKYQAQNSYRFNNNVLTMIQFSHVIHQVFGGWVVVEINTKHYTFL